MIQVNKSEGLRMYSRTNQDQRFHVSHVAVCCYPFKLFYLVRNRYLIHMDQGINNEPQSFFRYKFFSNTDVFVHENIFEAFVGCVAAIFI